jgi:hypothetical protein
MADTDSVSEQMAVYPFGSVTLKARQNYSSTPYGSKNADTTIGLFSLRSFLAKADFSTTTICPGMSKLVSIRLSPEKC